MTYSLPYAEGKEKIGHKWNLSLSVIGIVCLVIGTLSAIGEIGCSLYSSVSNETNASLETAFMWLLLFAIVFYALAGVFTLSVTILYRKQYKLLVKDVDALLERSLSRSKIVIDLVLVGMDEGTLYIGVGDDHLVVKISEMAFDWQNILLSHLASCYDIKNPIQTSVTVRQISDGEETLYPFVESGVVNHSIIKELTGKK